MLATLWLASLQRLWTSNPFLLGGTASFVFWASWRLWRFTISPILRPEEPKVLPYWVPFLGHTWAFIRNPVKLMDNGFHYFSGSHPFALTIAGRRTVILRDPQDVAAVWRNTQTLSFDPFVEAVLRSFGISSPTLAKIFSDPRDLIHGEARATSLLINENPQNKVYKNLERDWFKVQMLAPEALQKLQDNYCIYLGESLAWDSLSPTYVQSSKSAPEESKTVSLRRYCKYTISYCSTMTFFGRKLEQVAPDFLKDYQEFEEGSGKIFYRFPRFLIRSTHRYKDMAIDGLVNYLSIPEDERPELEWLFRTMNSELRNLEVPIHDIAGMMMIIIWAINNNAHKIAFWILGHLLHDSSYLAAVRSETDSAFSAPDAKPDVDVLLNKYPHLDAIWYEALRLYNATSAVRDAIAPCVIGGKAIRTGDQLVAPFRLFHLNPDIFGADAPNFSPERFLENKALPRTKGYAPFGGGHTYCPGRLFAHRESYMFVAETLWKFDLTLVPRAGGKRMPRVDQDNTTAAALTPDEDVLVQLRPRIHKH